MAAQKGYKEDRVEIEAGARFGADVIRWKMGQRWKWK